MNFPSHMPEFCWRVFREVKIEAAQAFRKFGDRSSGTGPRILPEFGACPRTPELPKGAENEEPGLPEHPR